MTREKNAERKVGLARVLSKLGYCSRSRAVELVRSGQVSVNGVVRKDPEWPVRMPTAAGETPPIQPARRQRYKGESDRIEVAGEAIGAAERVYLMMNKPRGVVTTASDEKGRRTVYDLLRPGTPWVGPVGRLDKASEGLLLLTNDSEWAAHITDPATHVDKTYHVQVATRDASALLEAVREGRRVDGEVLRVKSASLLRTGQKNAWLEIVLDEGRNRHIRRLLEALDVEVLRLMRVRIGTLELGDLKKGEVREIEKDLVI